MKELLGRSRQQMTEKDRTRALFKSGMILLILLQAFLITNRMIHKPMSAMFLLIGVSLIVAIGFLVAFLWAGSSGQFEDEETPAVRVLFDDDPAGKSSTRKESSKSKKENDPDQSDHS